MIALYQARIRNAVEAGDMEGERRPAGDDQVRARGGDGVTAASEHDLREMVEDLVRQFAHQTVKDGVPHYSTGGLSALEGAFQVLGWSDPQPAPEGGCEAEGCTQWATCGTPTPEGYKRLYYAHYRVLKD